MMKFEVGSSYRTRKGWRAKVVADDLAPATPFGVVHYDGDDDGPYLTKHLPNGRHLGIDDDPYDLIAEWVEPAKPLECWVVVNGPSRVQFDSREDAVAWVGEHTDIYTIKHMREVVGE